jgi:hypothetical protein
MLNAPPEFNRLRYRQLRQSDRNMVPPAVLLISGSQGCNALQWAVPDLAFSLVVKKD